LFILIYVNYKETHGNMQRCESVTEWLHIKATPLTLKHYFLQ